MENPTGEVYEIKIREPLDPSWSEWFHDFTIRRSEDQETILVGFVRDQTALHGLLAKIRNLNLTLISVIKVSDEEDSLS